MEKKRNYTTNQKLIIYDSVIRSKLVYGMESAQIDDAERGKTNTFQLKGIRQILNMKSTYGQKVAGEEMTNTNHNIIKVANEHLKEETRKGHKIKTIKNKRIVWETNEKTTYWNA